MVAEDNRLNRELLVELPADQYHILQAENGREAREILKQNAERIALVLLDMMMPVMDGYAFLDRIREDERLSLIPVIVATQSDSESDEISSLIAVKELPIDELKFDRALIKKGKAPQKDNALLKMLIDVSKELGMTVTQEGVETREDMNRMRALGCDIIQGYYYSKPMHIIDFIDFVNQDTSLEGVLRAKTPGHFKPDAGVTDPKETPRA